MESARQALIEKFGYTDEELPTAETIRVKLNELGYRLRALRKPSTSNKPGFVRAALRPPRPV